MLKLTRATPNDRDKTGLNWEFAYKGKVYPINLYYDTVLSFYELLDDEHFSDAEKVSVAFQMFFGKAINNADFQIEAFEKISQYLNSDPYVANDDQSSGSSTANPKYYSFEQDAEAIYASFYQQYGIDLLYQKQKMHWDQFKALFVGLSSDTYFMRIVQIRQEDATKLEGKAQLELINAQQRYALEESNSQEAIANQMQDFGDMLMAIAKS